MATSNGRAVGRIRFYSMSQIPLRFGFLAAALWLSATHAFAQEAPADITLRLSPAYVAEITRLIDLQPTTSQSPPAAYWDLQLKINETLKANPAALRAVLSARSARR
jgi:hypothetical protein